MRALVKMPIVNRYEPLRMKMWIPILKKYGIPKCISQKETSQKKRKIEIGISKQIMYASWKKNSEEWNEFKIYVAFLRIFMHIRADSRLCVRICMRIFILMRSYENAHISHW